MTEAKAKLKIALGDIRRHRRVEEPLHKLNARKKKNLLAQPIEVVFSVKFMQIALKKAPRSFRLSSKTSQNITVALKGAGANTLAQATKFSYERLDKLPNFGYVAMALYLDMLTAFDLPMPEVPAGRPIPEEFQDEALALAKDLALRV